MTRRPHRPFCVCVVLLTSFAGCKGLSTPPPTDASVDAIDGALDAEDSDYRLADAVSPTPAVTVADVTVDEDASFAAVVVRLEGPSVVPLTVEFTTSNGTATANADYTQTDGLLDFAPGETTKQVAVPILDDGLPETDESLFFTASNTTVPGAAATATVTVRDDDGSNASYAAIGYVLVTSKGADPSGQQDSTAAIQSAIDEAYEAGRAVLFPPGVYLVSDTLRCMQPQSTSGQLRPGHTLVGSTRGQRPVLRLKLSSSGFQDTSVPDSTVTGGTVVTRTTLKPVVHFWRQSDSGSADPELEASNKDWNQVFRNIDIDLGTNNPGAVGIRHRGAEGSAIQDVRIAATGSFAGVYNMLGSGGSITNLEVVGGRYGIYAPQSQPPPTIAGLRLSDQTVRAIAYRLYTPLTVVGFSITKQAGAVIDRKTYSHDSSGHIAFIDGTIELLSAGADDAMITNTDRSIYLKNVYVKGATKIVANGSGAPLTVSEAGQWTQIREYAYNGAYGEPAKLIDGTKSDTTLVNLAAGVQVPPPDLVSRHVWPTDFCSLESPGLVSVTDFGAVGDGEADDTEAIRAAIAASDRVLLPKGSYKVSGSITLRGSSHLYGVARHLSILKPTEWTATTNTPVVTTVDDADATSALCNLRIELYDPASRIFANRWRAGRRSIVKDVWVFAPYGIGNARARKRTVITGNGGGRWYNQLGHMGGAKDGRVQGTRHVLVDGTSEPLAFYTFHNQYIKPPGEPMSEIIDASNVTIYGHKGETIIKDFDKYPAGTWPIVMAVRRSTNVQMYGYETHVQIEPGRGVFEVEDSTNVTIVNVTRRGNGSDAYHDESTWSFVKETYDASIFTVNATKVLSLFRRGQ